MFSLGVITDEVSQDFEQALMFAKSHGLSCVELRSAWEKGPFEFTDEDILKIRDLSEKYQLPIVAISSPMFKCDYFDETQKRAHLEQFRRLVKRAELLGVKTIRCFDFFCDSRIGYQEIKEAYAEPIKLCQEAGITIVIESEPTTNSSDCQKLGNLIRAIDHPTVRALYDPGNNLYAPTDEIPYPDGFEHIKDIYAHVHIKDAVRLNGKTEGRAVGQGEVNYPGVFCRLLRTGYEGYVMLETHYKPNATISEELLKNPKGSAISFMGDIASAECLTGLKRIIAQAREEVK